MGRSEGNTPLGRPQRTWEDNIKMDLRSLVVTLVTGYILLKIGLDVRMVMTLQGSLKVNQFINELLINKMHITCDCV